MKLTEEKMRGCTVSDKDIVVDMDITLHEIKQYREELSVFRKNPTENRWDIMKRETWIRDREEFVDHLKQIQEWRKCNASRE